MNKQTHSNNRNRAGRIFLALLAGFFLIPGLRAQPTEPAVDNRLLLIFDTSADMKKRLPAVRVGLSEALATSLRGALQPGDSSGVWTFDEQLHAGQYPLQIWQPEKAADISSNIIEFVAKQPYSKTTSFAVLQSALNRVVVNSERLTVLIFCDGETDISGTPFDTGINQIFQKRRADQKKAKQPFIVIFRAQLGEYAGCTVNFPPLPVNYPSFPPLPPPPAPPEPVPDQTPPPPPVVLPPLIIVGTNVGTNFPPPEPKPDPTNPPPVQTNIISAPPTNAVAPPPENSDLTGEASLAIGAALLAAAGGLAVFMLRRSRRTDSASLITRTMKKD
jgi:hypothetical protein